MNIIKSLIERIDSRLQETKEPCKTYATEERAEAAAEKMSHDVAEHFAKNKNEFHPARYVVVFIPKMNRWTYCIDMTELLMRSSSTGGYIGFCKDIFTF